MFTGLVEELGVVVERTSEDSGVRFRLRGMKCSSDLSPGDSIAVSGVCQTVILRDDSEFEIMAIPETLSRTTFGSLEKGSRVNLERPLRMGDRLGGHWVSGHVDARGLIVEYREVDGGRSYQVRTDQSYGMLLVEKGSITIDGVSMTVGRVDDLAAVAGGSDERESTLFWVHVIPETWERTLFGSYAIGHEVNLEFDLLGKYILRAQDLGSARERNGS